MIMAWSTLTELEQNLRLTLVNREDLSGPFNVVGLIHNHPGGDAVNMFPSGGDYDSQPGDWDYIGAIQERINTRGLRVDQNIVNYIVWQDISPASHTNFVLFEYRAGNNDVDTPGRFITHQRREYGDE